jgi:hypothetical protein
MADNKLIKLKRIKVAFFKISKKSKKFLPIAHYPLPNTVRISPPAPKFGGVDF